MLICIKQYKNRSTNFHRTQNVHLFYLFLFTILRSIELPSSLIAASSRRHRLSTHMWYLMWYDLWYGGCLHHVRVSIRLSVRARPCGGGTSTADGEPPHDIRRELAAAAAAASAAQRIFTVVSLYRGSRRCASWPASGWEREMKIMTSRHHLKQRPWQQPHSHTCSLTQEGNGISRMATRRVTQRRTIPISAAVLHYAAAATVDDGTGEHALLLLILAN